MQSVNLINTESYEEMSKIASDMIIEIIKKYPNSLYCFAAGDTPIRTLELLVEAHKEKVINLCEAYYVGLDEWVGIDETNQGSCLAYLNRHLFLPAGVPKDHIYFFNAKSKNLSNECELANDYINHHNGIKLSLLGVGVNGHLGFNEPKTNFSSLSHVVELSATTKKVGEKYFNSDIQIDKGITLGIKQLLDSKYIILEAHGKTKKKALNKLLEGNVTEDWPVTALRLHKNCTVITSDLTDSIN